MTAQGPVKVALFSELNSKFGKPFLVEMAGYAGVSICGLVTTPFSAPLCSYYVGEPDPVNLSEEAHGRQIPVMRPGSVNDPGFVKELAALAPDYLVIANFQQIFKPALLTVPTVATVNFHPSPLPRYAGLAPFFWMAKFGERNGGVSAVVTDAGIDAGPLLAQTLIPLAGTESAQEIRTLHFDESFRLLRQVLPKLAVRCSTGVPQDLSMRSYFGRPTTDDYAVDWAEGVESVLRTVRASNPRPGALAFAGDGSAIRVLSARPAAASARLVPLGLPGQVACYRPGEVMVAARDGWITVELAIQGPDGLAPIPWGSRPGRLAPGPLAATAAAGVGRR